MLFLTLDCFSQTGGIQKVCRILSYALTKIATETGNQNFKAYSLYDTQPNEDYLKKANFKGFKGRKISFIICAFMKGVQCNRVIISHINLLPLALFIKFFNRSSKLFMMAHGIEVWKSIPVWKRTFINKHVHVLSVSHFTKNSLQTTNKILPNKIEVLKNCIDPNFRKRIRTRKPANLLRKYGLTNNQPILLSMTRINSYEKGKGYDKVIQLIPELLKEYPNLYYLLCGKCDETEKLRLTNLINSMDIQNHVCIAGFIPDHELQAHYLLSDVFVLPSKKEGFGLVFIEAASCGCRIISGNADGSTDAMLNGKLGSMIDPDDLNELANAIKTNLSYKASFQEKKKIQNLCFRNFNYHIYQNQLKKLLFKEDAQI